MDCQECVIGKAIRPFLEIQKYPILYLQFTLPTACITGNNMNVVCSTQFVPGEGNEVATILSVDLNI